MSLVPRYKIACRVVCFFKNKMFSISQFPLYSTGSTQLDYIFFISNTWNLVPGCAFCGRSAAGQSRDKLGEGHDTVTHHNHVMETQH